MKAYGQNRQCNNHLKPGPRGNSPGFTLIELMIVVAIIAVMGLAAVPAVNSYMTRHALQYATDELYGDIQLARMRAAKNNQRCRIVFDHNADKYTLQDYDNNGTYIRDFKVGDLGKFRNGINFCNSPNAANPLPFTQLEFLSQGTLNAAAVLPAVSNSVYLTNQANDVFYQVLVSLAGGTGVYRWDPSANQWR